MVKKLQALKAKKGFTLVELIVVIAIIAVLAAILVPTMLGYVTSSRVTSANTTAASIKNNIDSFLTNADTAGYGMKQGSTINESFDILVTTAAAAGSVPSWSVGACTATNFKTGGTITWGTAGSGNKDTTKVGVTGAETLLAIELANLFPEIKSASIHVLLNGGKCVGVAYTADQNTALTVGTDCPSETAAGTALAFVEPFAWDTKTAGVTSSGLIVGTAPVIGLG